MKIRFLGNSIRLRLTQLEVQTLADGGLLETIIAFPGEALAFVVQPSDGPVSAHHAAGRITVSLPRAETAVWADSDEVGLYAEVQSLRVAIEKDYTCIHKPDSPDNAGTFPNPLGAQEDIG